MTKGELSQKTVPELTALAKELGIVVKGRRKADIIAGILKAGKKAAPSSAKEAPEKPGKPRKKVRAKKAAAKAKKQPARAAGKALEKRKEPGGKVAAKKAPPAARARAVAPEQSFKKKDLAEKTVAGLRALARELGITARDRRKDDLIAEIQKASRRLRVKTPGVVREAPPEEAARRPAKEKVPPKEKMKPRPEASERPRRQVERKAPSVAAKPLAPKPAPAMRKPAAERPSARPRKDYEIGAVMPSAPEMREVPAEAAVAERLTAIVVDHRQIFVNWQLREAAHREGFPAIRVYDSTGVVFSAKRARSFFDLLLHSASGSAYIDVMPGRELFVALGVMGPGGLFFPVKTTGRLFVPRERAPKGKAILPEEYFKFRPPRY